jgi:hypothetical protein
LLSVSYGALLALYLNVILYACPYSTAQALNDPAGRAAAIQKLRIAAAAIHDPPVPLEDVLPLADFVVAAADENV